MTEQHPITPPPELVEEWCSLPLSEEELLVIAAQWGADQELEACCEWLEDPDLNVDTYKLREARRPKPLSLKEQALETLQRLSKNEFPCSFQEDADWDTIRRALEALPDA
jgi:hypothetical protein